MSYMMDHYTAAYAAENERAAFIRRTYGHLAGAILAFTAIEGLIFTQIPLQTLQATFLRFFASPISALLIFGAFIAVGWVARMWARSNASPALQYVGLGLYVLFEALIFVPILTVAIYYADPTILPTAAILTLCIFAGLTLIVFTSGKDFSFLRGALCIGSMLAFGVIIAAMIFPASLQLGLWFSLAMVVLASGFILYDTSLVMYHFRTDQHVAASLELFASVAYLFYYVLRVLLELQRNRN